MKKLNKSIICILVEFGGRGVNQFGITRKCMFNVKSAWHLAQVMKRNSKGESSNTKEKDVWKKLWNLEVRGSVK